MGLPLSPDAQTMTPTDCQVEMNEADDDYLKKLGFAGNSGGSAQALLRRAHAKGERRSSQKHKRPSREAAEPERRAAEECAIVASDDGNRGGATCAAAIDWLEGRVHSERHGGKHQTSPTVQRVIEDDRPDNNMALLSSSTLSPGSTTLQCPSSQDMQTPQSTPMSTPLSSCNDLRNHSKRRFAKDNKKRGPTPTAWRLAWCHEHCHKTCNDDRRRSLWHISRRCGASLVCLKKAARFAMWLTSASRPRYVLLTDWREAKPCMTFIPNHTTPTVTVVHADCDQVYRKASDWVKQLPAEFGPAVVVRDLEEVDEEFLQSFMGPPVLSLPALPDSRPVGEQHPEHIDTDDEKCLLDMDGSDASEPTSWPQQAAMAMFMQMGTTPPSSSSSVATVGANFLQASPPSSSSTVGDHRSSEMPALSPTAQALTPTALTAPVFNTLWPVFSNVTDQQLNKILADAMPECYTD